MSSSGSREQRKYERSPAPAVGLVDVFIDDEKSTSRHKVRLGPSLLEDISQGGLAIQMDRAVGVGRVLYLSNRYVSYVARVCHCRPVGAGFRLGLEFVTKEESAMLAAMPRPSK